MKTQTKASVFADPWRNTCTPLEEALQIRINWNLCVLLRSSEGFESFQHIRRHMNAELRGLTYRILRVKEKRTLSFLQTELENIPGPAWIHQWMAVYPRLKYKQCLNIKANIHGRGGRKMRRQLQRLLELNDYFNCVNSANRILPNTFPSQKDESHLTEAWIQILYRGHLKMETRSSHKSPFRSFSPCFPRTPSRILPILFGPPASSRGKRQPIHQQHCVIHTRVIAAVWNVTYDPSQGSF